MTREEKATFVREGLVLLPRAVPARVTAALKKHVLDQLAQQGIWSHGRALSRSLRALPPFQQVATVSSTVKAPELATQLGSERVLAALGAVADGVALSLHMAQVLVSLPHQGASTLHGLNWHVDVARPAAGKLPGVQAFLLLDDVAVNGGATLAVTGSHALSPEAVRNVRGILKGRGDLKADLARHGVAIREMSGDAGDVYLMDMRTLHSPSINATPRIRLMATVRYLAAGSAA